MKYLIDKIENGIKISGLKNFNLSHIFENGQAFRWEKTEQGSYIVIYRNQVAEFLMQDESLYAFNIDESDFVGLWHNYFNLDADYDYIKEQLRQTKAYKINDSLKDALEFAYGLRILNQDKFEMIISFIISANNRIGQIKRCIDLLSKNYGDYIGDYKGKKYYAFPKPDQLAFQDPEKLKELTRVGFRNTRIVEASKRYLLNPEYFENDNLLSLKENLIDLPGVGPKVMDCILLFGYGIENTFPIDVWVKRLMEYLYIKKSVSNKKILESARELFGDYLGHAQQYLFYYARENSIGK